MTLEKAFKVLDDLVKRSTPKPIKEAPKDGNELLTCNTRQGCMKGLMCWSQICERWESKGEPIYVQPTHYLPLPDFSTEHAAELAAAIETLRAAIGGAVRWEQS